VREGVEVKCGEFEDFGLPPVSDSKVVERGVKILGAWEYRGCSLDSDHIDPIKSFRVL